MRKELLAQEWIKRWSKGKIQAFQDAFARVFGISLCLVSPSGEPLTVWSNSSLFCHSMVKKNRSRCMQERENALSQTLQTNKSTFYTCYLGLTFFLCPVFYRGEMICFAYGGGFKLDPGGCDMGKADGNIPLISEKQLKNMLIMLEETLTLLNYEADSGKTEAVSDSQDLALFQNKLSGREIQIVRLINTGMANREIGEQLFISEKTVKTHVSNILTKLGIKDRMQLLVFCRQHNIR